jgi:hypothetical protein
VLAATPRPGQIGPHSAFVVEDWTPVQRNTLRGFARVRTPSGTVFHDVAVHQKNGSTWASPASKPMISRDGTVMRDAAGKVQYSPVVGFASRETRDRWSAAVVNALLARCPDALS